MKMIDRFKAQTNFEKMMISWTVLAFFLWLYGILFGGAFFSVSACLIYTMVVMTISGVAEIKRYISTIEFKFKDDAEVDLTSK